MHYRDGAVKDDASLGKIADEKIKQKSAIEPSERIQDVESLKDFCDKKDEHLIFKVDENEQIVFKSSKTKWKEQMK